MWSAAPNNSTASALSNSQLYSADPNATGAAQGAQDAIQKAGRQLSGSGIIPAEIPTSLRALDLAPSPAGPVMPAPQVDLAARARLLTDCAQQLLRATVDRPLGSFLIYERDQHTWSLAERHQVFLALAAHAHAIQQAKADVAGALAHDVANLYHDPTLGWNFALRATLYARWQTWAIGGAQGDLVPAHLFAASPNTWRL